jgi:hypothetical protein
MRDRLRDEDRALLDALDFHKNVRSALLEEQAADESDPLAASAAAAAIAAAERSRGTEAGSGAELALLAQKELIWFQQALQRQPPADATWSPGHRAPPRPHTATLHPAPLELERREQEQQTRQRQLEELRLLRRKQQLQRMWSRTVTASQPCLVGSDLKRIAPQMPSVAKPSGSMPERLMPEMVLRRARTLQQLELPPTGRPSSGNALCRQYHLSENPSASTATRTTLPSHSVQARRLHSRVSMYLNLRG